MANIIRVFLAVVRSSFIPVSGRGASSRPGSLPVARNLSTRWHRSGYTCRAAGTNAREVQRPMDGRTWLDDITKLYRKYKKDCERAAAQVSDKNFFEQLSNYPNSIAVLMKHLGGNHRSRWRDFLTSDGEKRDRDRDSEFTTEGETRASVMALWEEGWRITFDSLQSLQPADLERTVTIRGEPWPVPKAIERNLNHLVYHTGQIILLARCFAGDAWQTMSVAPGKSKEHNAEMRAKYGDWWEKEGK